MSPHLPNLSHGANQKDHDWPNFFLLVSISGLATLATIGNIFTISAIIVDDLLRKKGNSFLVSVALADLLVTAIALPASCVAILAQIEDSVNLCQFQYGIASMSCVTAAIFTAAVGIENFLRLRTLQRIEKRRQKRRGQPLIVTVHMMSHPEEKQSVCSQFQVTVLNLKMWLISGLVVLFHIILMPHLMYTICGSPEPKDERLLLHSITVLGITLMVFISLGGLGFVKCVFIMRSWEKPMPYVTAREFALVSSNFWNWLARFIIWCSAILTTILTLIQSQKSLEIFQQPFLPNLHASPSPTTSSTAGRIGTPSIILSSSGGGKATVETDYSQLMFKQLLVWPAILPSCLGSLIYAIANKDFRRCYIQLFNYCCCKTSVALTRRPRDNIRGGSDVRVHIIPGYNMYSSGSGHCNEVTATPPRFNTFKCGPLMSCRRDIYEL